MWDRFLWQPAYIGVTRSCMRWYVRKKYLTWVKTAETRNLDLVCKKWRGTNLEHFGLCYDLQLEFTFCMSSHWDGHKCEIFSKLTRSFQDMKTNVADTSREGLRFENSKIESRKDSWGTPGKTHTPPWTKNCMQGNVKKGWLKFLHLRLHSFL